MTKRNKTKELLVIALVLNAAVIGLYAFLFLEVKRKNEHVSRLVNEIETQSVEERTLASVKSLVVETASAREQLKRFFVERGGSVAFIELLESTARTAGAKLTIHSVAEEDVAGVPDVKSLKLSLAADGSWQSAIRFLGMLEYLPYQVAVEDVSLRTNESGRWVLKLALSALQEK